MHRGGYVTKRERQTDRNRQTERQRDRERQRHRDTDKINTEKIKREWT